MKSFQNIKYGLLVIFSGILSFGLAQDFSTIGTDMQSGNSATIAKSFDNNVELTILSTEATYSKSQAEMVLKNFFNNNSPKSYKAIHNGDSGSGAKYQIGELGTATGSYRTYVYAKNDGGSFVIQEIRIEEN